MDKSTSEIDLTPESMFLPLQQKMLKEKYDKELENTIEAISKDNYLKVKSK